MLSPSLWLALGLMVVGVVLLGFVAWALHRPSQRQKFVDFFKRGKEAGGEDRLSTIQLQATLDVIEKDHVPIGVWGHLCHGEIKEKEFRDCYIFGPAVLAVSEGEPSTFYGCSLYDTPDSILWPVPRSESPPPTGCVRLYSCTLYRCTFDGVGFAVPEGTVKYLKDDEPSVLAGGPPPTTA